MPKKSTQILHFGIDYLRLNYNAAFEAVAYESMFSGLSANSPQKNVVLFGVPLQATLTENAAKRIITLQYYGDAVMCIEKITDGGVVRVVSWTATFYSSFFYIEPVDEILTKTLKTHKEYITISRIDLALDTSCTVNELWDCHTTIAQKKQRIEDGQTIQTFYLGAKAKNKRHFIRVYDKRLDSTKKGKFHLFLNYLAEETVSRIELQVNALSVRTFGIEPLHVLEFRSIPPEKSFLWSVYRRCCLNKSTTDFSCIPGKKLKITRRRGKKLDEKKLLEELPYANVMLGYAKRLHNHGFDVLGYLRDHLFDVE